MGTAEQDFTAFYDATWSRTVACAYAVTGDVSAAEDVAQEAYARAWQRWAAVSRYDVPAAWVRQVACRLAVSRFRRARVGIGLLRRQGPPPDVPGIDPSRVALVEALKQIPEAQRLAIVLHHVAGLSVEEVAQEVGSPVGTVKARLSRGRAALAPLLGSTPNGEPSHA